MRRFPMTTPMMRSHVIRNNDIHRAAYPLRYPSRPERRDLTRVDDQHKETSLLRTVYGRWRCLCRPSKTLASGPAPTWVLGRSPS